MLPFDLPPPIPIVEPASVRSDAQLIFLSREGDKLRIAREGDKLKKKISKEEASFRKAVEVFQISLSKLDPDYKKDIREIHSRTVAWAKKQKRNGVKADQLSTFVGKVMAYANKQLGNIEKQDPDLLTYKAYHDQLTDVFFTGNEVIEAYLKWVKIPDDPRPKRRR